MSYPEMNPGVTWSLVKSGFHKTPSFKSSIQKTGSGRGQTAVSYKPYATWNFEVDLNYVRGGETVQYSVLQRFLGCYLKTCGAGNLFYFTDPNDNGVSDQSAMLNVTPGAAFPMTQTGDGVSTQFQLARNIDQGVDILQTVANVVVYVNNAVVSGVSISNTGVATFASAPANGAVLAWQGTFRYLCRFTEDTIQDLARVSKNTRGWQWSASSITFESEFV